jgi:ABC-2 type transport system ATP-binding protein
MVELHGLTKRFGSLAAVDDLSFTVERGDAFGFIGPNGAGKTTTLRMLATLLLPDAGTATINGYDIVKDSDQVRSSLGYMPDFFGVYDEMRVWEYLDFFAAAYRVPHRQRAGLIGDVLELVELTDKREVYVEALSRGMKQRLCLAKALLHDPEVLLLDEPASGLDPRSRIEMRQLLQELCKMDKTIIISSHILTELAELCNKVAIIERGRLVMAGALDEISAKLRGGRRLIVRVTDRGEETCRFLSGCQGVQQSEIADGQIIVTFTGSPEQQHQLLATLISRGFPVESFSEEVTGLEDMYMKLTEKEQG